MSNGAVESLVSRAIQSETEVNRVLAGVAFVPAAAKQALRGQAGTIRALACEVETLRQEVAALKGK